MCFLPLACSGSIMYAYPQIQFYPYALSLYSNGMAGIKLKVPISSFYTNKHKVKVAEIQLHRQEVEDEEVKETFARKFRNIISGIQKR
jgi:outer membrane protein